MTSDELNDALDALQTAAADDETLLPGLIEISVDDWIQRLAEMQTARPKTIVDGIRIRDIMVAVTGGSITRTLTRPPTTIEHRAAGSSPRHQRWSGPSRADATRSNVMGSGDASQRASAASNTLGSGATAANSVIDERNLRSSGDPNS